MKKIMLLILIISLLFSINVKADSDKRYEKNELFYITSDEYEIEGNIKDNVLNAEIKNRINYPEKCYFDITFYDISNNKIDEKNFSFKFDSNKKSMNKKIEIDNFSTYKIDISCKKAFLSDKVIIEIIIITTIFMIPISFLIYNLIKLKKEYKKIELEYRGKENVKL